MKYLLSLLVVCCFALPVQACDANKTREDVWVLVNVNSDTSRAIGDYYIAKRCISPGHVINIFAPVTDEIPSVQYDSISAQIAAHLDAYIWNKYYDFSDVDPAVYLYSNATAYLNYLTGHIRGHYFVTTKDVPYRVLTPNIKEPASLDAILAAKYKVAVGRIDGLSKETAQLLVDRAIDAEEKGVAGKFYVEGNWCTPGSSGWYHNCVAVKSLPTEIYSPAATDLPINQVFNKTSLQTDFRYVFGLANEQQSQCTGTSTPFHAQPQFHLWPHGQRAGASI